MNSSETVPALRRLFRSELWGQSDFRNLFASHTISVFGSQITYVALPLVAIITLEATESQMGLLRAVQTIPALILGLGAGVLIDRVRRRRVMLWTDIGRALVLASIPLSAAAGFLNLGLLYIVAFLIGCMTVMFDIARFSFLPSVVTRERLTDANSKMEVSWSSSQIAGPSTGGALVQATSAPAAILIDATSFLFSAAFLARVKAPEASPAQRPAARGVGVEILEGLRFVLSHRLLRPLVTSTAVFMIGYGMFATVFILFLSRELQLSPAYIGIVLAANGPGFVLGALLAERASTRIGVGPTLVLTQIVTGLGLLAFSFATGPNWAVVLLFVALQTITGVAGQISGVNQIALRQHVTPGHLLGRTNATMRFISWSGAPIAALSAGFIASAAGLRPTLALAAAIMLLAVLPLALSPLRTTRELLDTEHR